MTNVINDMYSADNMQQSMSFMIKQTAHLEAAVNAASYPDVQYPFLTPVDTSAHPFARTVQYRSSDEVGRAEWLNGNADDIPLADVKRGQHETSIHMAGIGYAYGYEEVGQAQMLGIPLESDRARAARRASEQMIERIAMYGDAEKGFQGLTNNTNVNVSPVTNGDWENANEYDIVADVNDAILGVSIATNNSEFANTLLVSHEKWSILATKPLGNDGSKPIMAYLQQYNAYTAATGQPLTIRAVRGLETAGAAGSSRMIVYRRDPEVLKMHLPMPHRFLPVHRDGVLNYVVPGIFRVGGIDIRRPAEVRYKDGL